MFFYSLILVSYFSFQVLQSSFRISLHICRSLRAQRFQRSCATSVVKILSFTYILLVFFADVLLGAHLSVHFYTWKIASSGKIASMLAASTEELGVILLQARISVWGACGFLFNGFILVVSVTSRGWMGVDNLFKLWLRIESILVDFLP